MVPSALRRRLTWAFCPINHTYKFIGSEVCGIGIRVAVLAVVDRLGSVEDYPLAREAEHRPGQEVACRQGREEVGQQAPEVGSQLDQEAACLQVQVAVCLQDRAAAYPLALVVGFLLALVVACPQGLSHT